MWRNSGLRSGGMIAIRRWILRREHTHEHTHKNTHVRDIDFVNIMINKWLI